MIVAISQRNTKMDKGANRDCLENDYVQYYESFGIALLPIPNASNNLEKYFDDVNIEAVILTGGGDINPALYGKMPTDEEYSEQRDNTENKLIQIAIKRNVPLFGNCRGAQFINVFFGGSLIQNIEEKTGFKHVGTIHKVTITDNEVSNFYKKKEFSVNSFHNHGIDKNTLSKKLKSFAVSKDGIIEGFYHPKLLIAGILWHPERKDSDSEADKKLIKAFLNRKLFWKII